MERFIANCRKENEETNYVISLDFVLGRGNKTEKKIIKRYSENDRNKAEETYMKAEKRANDLNCLLHKEISLLSSIDIDEKNTYIKNLNSIIISSEFSALISFSRLSRFDLTDIEEQCLELLIQEKIFGLENLEFEDLTKYIYSIKNISEMDYGLAIGNIIGKLPSLMELIECYLIEEKDCTINELLSPKNKGTFFIHEWVTDYNANSTLFLDNSIEMISSILCRLISLKSGIGLSRLIEIFRTQGERRITKEGLSVCKDRPSKSQQKLFRSYNIPIHELSLLTLDKLILHTLIH